MVCVTQKFTVCGNVCTTSYAVSIGSRFLKPQEIEKEKEKGKGIEIWDDKYNTDTKVQITERILTQRRGRVAARARPAPRAKVSPRDARNKTVGNQGRPMDPDPRRPSRTRRQCQCQVG